MTLLLVRAAWWRLLRTWLRSLLGLRYLPGPCRPGMVLLASCAAYPRSVNGLHAAHRELRLARARNEVDAVEPLLLERLDILGEILPLEETPHSFEPRGLCGPRGHRMSVGPCRPANVAIAGPFRPAHSAATRAVLHCDKGCANTAQDVALLSAVRSQGPLSS